MSIFNWCGIIKENITIREVIEHYCGKSSYINKVKSPFTNEKTPSLHIYDKTDTFKDFSSGYGGDLFVFVEKLFNVDNYNACLILAKDFGINLNNFKRIPSEEIEKMRLQKLKKKRQEELKEKRIYELQKEILSHLRMFEEINKISKPYSLKNLGGYRQSKYCDLYIWAEKNLKRLEYLYRVVSNLPTDDFYMDLETVGFYAYDKASAEQRQKQILDKYLANELILII